MSILRLIGFRCINLILAIQFIGLYIAYINGYEFESLSNTIITGLILGIITFTPSAFLCTIYTLGEIYVNKSRK